MGGLPAVLNRGLMLNSVLVQHKVNPQNGAGIDAVNLISAFEANFGTATKYARGKRLIEVYAA